AAAVVVVFVVVDAVAPESEPQPASARTASADTHARINLFTVHSFTSRAAHTSGVRSGRLKERRRAAGETRRRHDRADGRGRQRKQREDEARANAGVERGRRARDGEKPAREDPGGERDRDLQREPDEECGRREEERQLTAVDKPLDVLLDDEGR